jgi:hypothetical protein
MRVQLLAHRDIRCVVAVVKRLQFQLLLEKLLLDL